MTCAWHHSPLLSRSARPRLLKGAPTSPRRWRGREQIAGGHHAFLQEVWWPPDHEQSEGCGGQLGKEQQHGDTRAAGHIENHELGHDLCGQQALSDASDAAYPRQLQGRRAPERASERTKIMKPALRSSTPWQQLEAARNTGKSDQG